MAFLEIHEDRARGVVTVSVRVQPRAGRTEIAGVMEGAIKVRLCAPAAENRANEALIEFLAGVLKTPKSAVRIRSGLRGRNKQVEIAGVSREHIERLLRTEA